MNKPIIDMEEAKTLFKTLEELYPPRTGDGPTDRILSKMSIKVRVSRVLLGCSSILTDNEKELLRNAYLRD